MAKTPNEEISVGKDKDLFVYGSKPSKLLDASKRMIDMGNKTFKEMGVE